MNRYNREFCLLLGFACGRVDYRPQAKFLYSLRLFLVLFRVELLWSTGPITPLNTIQLNFRNPLNKP